MNSPVRPFRPPVRSRLLLGAILLVAFALRLWGLDQHNIWWDEGFTVWISRLPVLQLLDRTAHDVHPPLSYLLQRGWWLLAGEGEWPQRFLSSLGGTTAVAAVYVFARRLGGRRAGLLAAAFLALSVFAVTWSQEIRMYAWVSVWGLLALYASLRVWARPDPAPFVLYVLATAAGLLSLYLFVAVPVVVNLAFVVFWWRARRPLAALLRWAAAQLAVLALFGPWLAYALPRMPSWSSTEPYSPTFFVRLYATVLATGMGENIDAWLLPTLVVTLVAVVCGALLAARRKSALEAGAFALLLFAIILPPTLVYAVTAFPGRQLHVPRLAPRYFLPLAAAFSAFLGWGLSELNRRSRSLALTSTGCVVAVALASLLAVLPARVATDQYVSLVDTLRAYEHPGDRVLLYPDDDWPLFAARYPGSWAKVPAAMDLTPENVPGLLQAAWDSAEGIWLVTTPKAQETDPHGLVPAWLKAQAQVAEEWDFGETKLLFYPRTPARAGNRNELYEFGRNAKWRTFGDWFAGETGAGASIPLRRYRVGDTLHLAVYYTAAPEQQVICLLRGPSPREFVVPAPKEAREPVRTLAHFPLTPDMHAGRYEVYLRDEEGREFHAGGFDLVAVQLTAVARVNPQQSLDLRLGEHIRLIGYDLPQQTVRPGEFAILTLYWQTDAVLTDRYKVFTHLIGTVWNAEQGSFLWGQQDNEPQVDQLPTTRWPPGEVIVDRYRVKLDSKAPAGTYQVEVGMYGLLDGARLKFQDGRDAVILGAVPAQ